MKNLTIIVCIFIFAVIGCRSGKKSGFSSRRQMQPSSRRLDEPSRDTRTPSAKTFDEKDVQSFAQFIADSKMAIINGDTENVEAMYGDEFSATLDGGKTYGNKAQLLKTAQTKTPFNSVNVENAKLLQYDDSAAQLSCDTIFKGDGGTTFTTSGTYTLVYRGDDWQITAYKGTIK